MNTHVANSPELADLTEAELHASVASPQARCTSASVDPDEWFPLTADPVKARHQAARAMALCAACRVRPECLELSLRLWPGAGHHGIWGGTLESERRALREEWLRGVSVRQLLHRDTAA